MKKYCFLLSIIVLIGCSSTDIVSKKNRLIGFVDPFIGTQREGNQLPGPRCPFGMIQPNPVNVGKDAPGATNYVFGKPEIYGIALTNMVGVGCANFGSILVMPTMNDVNFKDNSSTYTNEKASVGYYSVTLDKHNIQTEITSSVRSTVLRFHYPKGKANVLIDLSRRMPSDSAFMIRKVSDSEIEGFKTDGNFCSAGESFHHTVYFVAKTDIPASSSGVFVNQALDSNIKSATGEDIGAFFSYQFNTETVLTLKVGISYVSIENARENLEKEIGDKSFAEVQSECEQSWEQLLSRIQVESEEDNDKKKFYTALYHTMSHPNILDDVNGEYPAMGSHITKKVKEGEHRFTIFSLWDTYRTLHPFFTLVYPEIQAQMSRSLMDMYRENGWLPLWELMSKETHVMLGDPASIVLTDSYLKGIRYDNPDSVLKAMIHNAENFYTTSQWGAPDVAEIRRSIVPYNKNNGWIPYDYKYNNQNHHWATVATTQEYNLADWNIAQMAKKLNKKDISEKYLERSKGYKHLYNPATGFFQQRWENGKWVEPFNPFAGRWPPQAENEKVYDMGWPYSGGPGYCEGMSWHYNFFIPHDMKAVIELMGGDQAFTNRLQLLFDSAYYEATNEPDIAYPFLFNYAKGEEWRTQKTVRHLIDNEFGIGPEGIPGNDDTGTMSAWLIFAMMGFYPDCPGSLDYQICSPVFDKVTIKLNSNYYKGKEFTITVDKKERDQIFIESMKLNNIHHAGYTISHSDIVNGGSLTMILKSKP